MFYKFTKISAIIGFVLFTAFSFVFIQAAELSYLFLLAAVFFWGSLALSVWCTADINEHTPGSMTKEEASHWKWKLWSPPGMTGAAIHYVLRRRSSVRK